MKPVNVGPFNYEWMMTYELPILVIFGSVWDLNSRKLIYQLESIGDKYKGKLRTAIVDYEHSADIFIDLGIEALPTLAIIEDGKIFTKKEGYTGSSDVQNLLDYFFGVVPHEIKNKSLFH